MLSNKVSNSNVRQSVNPNQQTPTVTTSQTSGNVPAGLEKGQLLQGEIVDVKYNNISIKLEDGRILTGKLEDALSLSIGDMVTFRVEEVSLKSLILKVLTNSQPMQVQNTINKALEAAGLNKTSLNRSIVSELFQQQMPVDKKTILGLVRQALNNKNVPVSTLVLMNRFHIPVDANNVKQFDSFLNNNFNLMKEFSNLIDQITELFHNSTWESYDSQLELGTQLLNLLTKEPNSDYNSDKYSSSDKYSFNPIKSSVDSSPNVITANLPQTIVQEHYNEGLIGNTVSQPLHSLPDDKALSLLNHIRETPELYDSLSKDLIIRLEQGNLDTDDIKLILNSERSQNKRIDLLDPFHLPMERKAQIQSGTFTATDILQWLKTNLSQGPKEAVIRLFQSKEFSSLIKESLTEQWTLTPKDVNDGKISEHYQNVSRHLNELVEYAELNAKQLDQAALKQANVVQNNINFAQTLNEIFHFVPLPLKFQNQTTHGELFVYSKNKSKLIPEEGIRLLLHLDMDHLGPVTIHINLQGKHIISKFYLEDTDTVNLVSSYMERLELALEKKGYTLKTEVVEIEDSSNVIEEFIKQDSLTSNINRYNFDVRA